MSTLGWILMLISSGLIAGSGVLTGRQIFHWFQLESYQFPGFFRTIRRQGIGSLWPEILLAVILAGSAMMFRVAGWNNSVLVLIVSAVVFAVSLYIHGILKKRPSKKKLVMTARMKRLYFICGVFFFLVLMLANGLTGFSWFQIIAAVFFILLPLWFSIGALLAWPVEKLISEMYFRDAQRILQRSEDLIKIGITGSWGKTSVKFILGSLLSEKYPTLVTPASYNTPMGVTKVIRTMLEPGHRIFVAEMGARHVGDIREMCRLVHPEIGILTSVGPQHLDTFKTLDRIKKTKYELMDAIPEDGECFFADDDGIVYELWEKTKKKKHLAGLKADRDNTWGENVRVHSSGSRFTLCHGEERIECSTELLGELNIRNIILCADVCFALGMTGNEIARGIRKLKGTEHRLQLKNNQGGITVIDDAFNSNIAGAKQAFEVLSEFEGKRIVVTPGMVELGESEEEMNRQFGAQMADCCDMAILVGEKRSIPIQAGLISAGFDRKRIRVVRNLNEAQRILSEVAGIGDVILFENDLPDNYDEN